MVAFASNQEFIIGLFRTNEIMEDQYNDLFSREKRPNIDYLFCSEKVNNITKEPDHNRPLMDKRQRKNKYKEKIFSTNPPGFSSGHVFSKEELRMHIALRAYELYLKRGCEDGHDFEDWLLAEKLVQDEYFDS